jgi:hypothetical protein
MVGQTLAEELLGPLRMWVDPVATAPGSVPKALFSVAEPKKSGMKDEVKHRHLVTRLLELDLKARLSSYHWTRAAGACFSANSFAAEGALIRAAASTQPLDRFGCLQEPATRAVYQ